jgi:hypothetical protein
MRGKGKSSRWYVGWMGCRVGSNLVVNVSKVDGCQNESVNVRNSDGDW